MNVRGTMELVSWVLGFGSKARVLAPKSLRDEIAAELRVAISAEHEQRGETGAARMIGELLARGAAHGARLAGWSRLLTTNGRSRMPRAEFLFLLMGVREPDDAPRVTPFQMSSRSPSLAQPA